MTFQVETAKDGRQGLKRYRARRPDLVITDLLMPRMDGFQLLDAIRAEDGGARTPVIVCSALFHGDQILEQLQNKYRARVLRKPFTPRQLAEAVARTFNSSSRIEPRDAMSARRRKEAASTRKERPEPRKRRRTHRSRITAQGLTPVVLEQGELADRPLPRILLDAMERRRMGYLDLKRKKIHKRIYLMMGFPVFVESALRAETLGQVLVNSGRLARDVHSQVVRYMTDHDVMYGEALIRMEIMAEYEVLRFLEVQVRRKMEPCLSWRDGTWEYCDDDTVAARIQRHTVDPVEFLFRSLPRYVNMEQVLHELGADAENHRLELLPRGVELRSRFVDVFGDQRLQAVEEGRYISELLQMEGLLETVEQAHVLLHCGLARRVRHQRPAPPPPSEEADVLDLSQLAHRATTSREVPTVGAGVPTPGGTSERLVEVAAGDSDVLRQLIGMA